MKNTHMLNGTIIGVISRLDRQENRGHPHSEKWIIDWSGCNIQLKTEATHFLESRGQAPSVGSKSSSPWKPLTCWGAKDRCHEQGPNPAHHRSYSPTGEPRTSIISKNQIQLTIE